MKEVKLFDKNEYQRRYNKEHPEVRLEFLETNPDYQKKVNQRRIKFKGNHVLLKENNKIGVCSKCEKSVSNDDIPYTVWHHLKYDDERPEDHVVELCMSCHRKEHVIEYSINPVAVYMRQYRARKKLENGEQ
ncbi:MAG TPA: hypothetical protein ENH82_00260 [bacterium]|nr:hypothetical protein [bacterium]